MLIFACDPGGTTGWASYSTETKVFDGGQLGPDEHHQELWNLLMDLLDTTEVDEDFYIVSESFEFRNNVSTEERRKGLELVSRDYIGVMKLFSKMYSCYYVEQMPSARMKITDEKLEALDLLKTPKHPNRHEHDALRHLLLFLVFRLKQGKELRDKWKQTNDQAN